MKKYLEHLGFHVTVDNSQEQDAVSCGYIAAMVGLMTHLAGAAWTTALTHAWVDRANWLEAHNMWVREGNAFLLQHWAHLQATGGAQQAAIARARIRKLELAGSNSIFLQETEIHALSTHWQRTEERRLPEPAGPPCSRCDGNHLSNMCPTYSQRRPPRDFLLGVDSRDGTLQDIAADVRRMASGSLLPGEDRMPLPNEQHAPLHIRVCNTDFSDTRGTHWFLIAYTIERA